MIDLELAAWVTSLASQNIQLSVRDGKLVCDCPKGALSEALRQSLRESKPRLLQYLAERDGVGKNGTAQAGAARIAALPPSDSSPLSHAQQRLWLLSQVDRGAAYNMRVAQRITGRLDAAALERALQAVAQRHAVLRSSFHVVNGEPVQRVREHLPIPLARITLEALPADKQRAELERLMAEHALHAFEVDEPPLMRATLVRLSPVEHVLLAVLHHLLADGSSLGIFVAELSELYQSAMHRRASRLPKLEVQYSDFAVWQRRALAELDMEELKAYWVKRLSGAPARLDLPTDRPRAQRSESGVGGSESFLLPPALSAQLQVLARSTGCTLFMTLLAGFTALLSRYANETDVVVGSPMSIRTHAELEPLIGMFVNTVVLRVGLDGNPTFQELLTQVRAVATDAYAHASLPLEQLVDAVKPPRDPAYHPIFQVMFIHDNAPSNVEDVAGLRFEALEYPTFDAKFDLMLAMRETPRGICGVWEYRRDLFDASTIQRASKHLENLFEAMALQPTQRVLNAPLVTSNEREALIRTWNETHRELARHAPLSQSFEAQVARAPHAVALESDEQTLSYAELDLRVGRLAALLHARGIGSGQRVAVLLPRGFDLVAALLAVLRLGAAYVPLDPSHPRARLSELLNDVAPEALLSSTPVADGLNFDPRRTLCIDAELAALEAASPVQFCAPICDGAVAYLMYTSGSTGKPKAAIITHRGLTNYLSWAADAYGMASGAGAVVCTSIAFDATVTSLWLPLMHGGRVRLLSEGRELEQLSQLLESDAELGLIKLTPAHIDALRVMTPEPTGASRAQTFVVGGEQLFGEQASWCSRAAPNAKVFNEYGPTETVVGCCVYEVPETQTSGPVCIGRPIANTQLYVLNPELELVPVGVPGELYIGGAGVARGYFQRDELTQRHFVADPFGVHADGRLYRTGDYAVRSQDGSLRFVGRRDAQVKVNGFRIELGEVESALLEHEDVIQATVNLGRSASERGQLIAHVVLRAGAPSRAALREYLASRLPPQLVPAAIVPVPEFPLTANGKLDRAALPEPSARTRRGRSATDNVLGAAELVPAAGREPATEAERVLVRIWQSLLGAREIDVTETFLNLGGDSILGIQLVARARQQGVVFTPRDLFEHRTIEKIALIAKFGAAAGEPQLATSGRFSLSAIQKQFFSANYSAPDHFNQSILLEAPVGCDILALNRACAAVVAHHDLLRARFPSPGEGTVERALSTENADWVTVVDLAPLSTEPQVLALKQQVDAEQSTLSLSAGPLFKAKLFRLGTDTAPRLLLTAHHLVVDGVSWRIIVEDLIRAYQQASSEQPIELPVRSTAFRDWSAQFQEHVDSGAFLPELELWASMCPPPRPLISVRPTLGTKRRGTAVSAYSVADTEPLLANVGAVYGVTAQEILLTALIQALASTVEGDVLSVELENHGRDYPLPGVDLSRTVGWFTSQFPVHFSVERFAGPGETLMRTKETLRVIPNHGVGYGALRYLARGSERVDALRRRLNGAPPAHVRFNYFGQLDRGQDVPGWLLASEAIDAQRSPLNRDPQPLAVDVSVVGRRLTVSWSYCLASFEESAVVSLADRFRTGLAQLIEHCQSLSSQRYTPSDFPDFQLSQDGLDQLLAEVSQANSGV